VVVSVGGYASFAPVVAALVLRIPVVLVNIDAVAGLAHRLVGRFAVASAVGFAGTALPRAAVTGTPVRPELLSVDRSCEARKQARSELGLPPDRFTVVAFGGFLGSRRINEAVWDLADRWRERDDLALYHVTGHRDWDRFARPRGGVPGGTGGECLAYRVVPFEDRMALLYAAADLVVCRAGAQTVAELSATGVPSVLVPLPGAPGDHQSANAGALVRAGAARLLPDGSCDSARLDRETTSLIADPERLDAMATSARALARPDAASRVAELVDGCARPGSDA
jgi:UDP-N-acetylglucosamine--N-acetylmuramyl-(pentapeptide) pyrophosphoryl-undecaprenol N-acetylglucosamine transferase